MKIIKTNWINFLGIGVAAFLSAVIFGLTSDDGISRSFLQSIVSACILVFMYGLLFWIGILIALILLDLFFIVFNPVHKRLKLLFQWFLISAPFIYWAIIYDPQRWIFLPGVLAFFVTQLMRERLILKAIM